MATIALAQRVARARPGAFKSAFGGQDWRVLVKNVMFNSQIVTGTDHGNSKDG